MLGYHGYLHGYLRTSSYGEEQPTALLDSAAARLVKISERQIPMHEAIVTPKYFFLHRQLPHFISLETLLSFIVLSLKV